MGVKSIAHEFSVFHPLFGKGTSLERLDKHHVKVKFEEFVDIKSVETSELIRVGLGETKPRTTT
jgi:hypothetical protein